MEEICELHTLACNNIGFTQMKEKMEVLKEDHSIQNAAVIYFLFPLGAYVGFCEIDFNIQGGKYYTLRMHIWLYVN